MSILFKSHLQGHSATLVFCLLPPTVSLLLHSHSTSLSSPFHPSFPLLSFVSPAPSFSPVARANCGISLNFGTRVTLCWDAGPSAAGAGGVDELWGMGNCTSTDHHIWLASQTLRNYTHNTQPPLAITSSPVGPSWSLGRSSTAAEWGENTIKQLFLWTRVAVGGLVWVPARLIRSVMDRVCPVALTWPLMRWDSGAVKQAAARDP